MSGNQGFIKTTEKVSGNYAEVIHLGISWEDVVLLGFVFLRHLAVKMVPYNSRGANILFIPLFYSYPRIYPFYDV